MWVGTDTGRVSQLQLNAQMSNTGLTYSIDLVQTLQLEPAHGITPGIIATPANLDPNSQLGTPFGERPRLTLSSSASSYRNFDGVTELVHDHGHRSPQPAVASAPAGAVLVDAEHERAAFAIPLSRQISGQCNGQPNGQTWSSQPLLGPQAKRPGQPPRYPPGRTMSAELMHGQPQQLPLGLPVLTPTVSAVLQAGSTSPAESPRSGHSQGQLHATGQTQGQLPAMGQDPARSPMRRTSSLQNAVGVTLPVRTADKSSRDGPVHAVAIVGGHVFTSAGPKARAILREWSTEGELLMTHLCSDLGKRATHDDCTVVLQQSASLPCHA